MQHYNLLISNIVFDGPVKSLLINMESQLKYNLICIKFPLIPGKYYLTINEFSTNILVSSIRPVHVQEIKHIKQCYFKAMISFISLDLLH